MAVNARQHGTMSEPFSLKFSLALKALSLSRGRLAADLGVDKSVVGRWATGVVRPSDHNLSRLTLLIAERVPGFTVLDWDRGLADFAASLGADPTAFGAAACEGLPLPMLEQVRASTGLRGAAYEGFFRSTRPYAVSPGRFLHDHGMIRLDENGLLRLRMGTGGTLVEGWMLPIHNQLVCICADAVSGAMMFGIFNGVAMSRAEVVDGIVLMSVLDAGLTPTAFAMMFERIGDLSGDPEADDRRFEELAALDPLAPQGSVPQEIQDHLTRDIGPAQLALGGDWLLQMPLFRSLSRGPSPIPDRSRVG